MEVIEAMRTRRSNKSYDPARSVDRDTITKLVEQACLSPSSFNMQHWRLVIVDEVEHKRALHALAFKQQQVLDAAATLIVVGDPSVYEKAEQHFGAWVNAGVFDEATLKTYVKMAFDLYDPPTSQAARDEAVRSCSLWAMSFMLVAWDQGLATCPMIGFDADGVQSKFHIPEPMFPVMLITLGYQAKSPRPRMARRKVDEIVCWNEFQRS